ncbi:MAG: hypothetical protein IT184_15705 [Acidobacteria bacterium]|nr:hypothetical protein [Acidobacteriota bacterium]
MRLPALVVSLLVIGVLVSATLAAQLRYRPTERGPWRPWSFTAIATARAARGATPAEVQAYEARLQELGAIVKRAPAVAEPIGFAAEIWGHLDGYAAPAPGQPAGRAVPLAGGLSFGAFPLIEYMRNGKLANEDLKGGETALLQFFVNRIGSDVFTGRRPTEWQADALEGFVEPEGGTSVAGLSRFDDVYVLKRHDRPLWLPVPLGDALAPAVAERRLAYETQRNAFAKQVAEFAEWQTPAKRAARRAGWTQAAATVPNGPELLANMEAADRQIEAANRERLAPGGPEDRAVRAVEEEYRAAERALATLSPAARDAASCYDKDAGSIDGRFKAKAAAPSPCRALVKPNWAYFDKTLPRSAPQVLMIGSFTRCLTAQSMAETGRGGCVINRALIDSLDWTAVRAWLSR